MAKRILARLVGLVLLSVAVGSGAMGAPWPRPAWAAESPRPLSEQERIAALLDAVGHSGAAFIREGKAYSAADGRKHLERKLRYAGDRVKTGEEFIEGIASRSSTTGRPYKVRLPGGEEMETGVWLRQKLAEIDGGR
ncbi:MAG TPA: DUF5329 domain-containing protein [Candidatus Methylomirabilis sp.]